MQGLGTSRHSVFNNAFFNISILFLLVKSTITRYKLIVKCNLDVIFPIFFKSLTNLAIIVYHNIFFRLYYTIIIMIIVNKYVEINIIYSEIVCVCFSKIWNIWKRFTMYVHFAQTILYIFTTYNRFSRLYGLYKYKTIQFFTLYRPGVMVIIICKY